MRTLYLDDSEERQKAAMEWHGKYWGEVTWCRTAAEAIDALDDDVEWDVVFLDHDLDGQNGMDSDNPLSGMEVVRWIVKNIPKIELIVVHSWNINAGKRMVRYLKNSFYDVSQSPFTGRQFHIPRPIYEQYTHHQKLVWVNSELKGHHWEYCLCAQCGRFNLDRRLGPPNCLMAESLYGVCKRYNLVTPVFECPQFLRIWK